MKSDASLTRREFVAATTTAATALVATPFRVFARDATENRFRIIGFTKPFQRLNFEDTADVVAEIGWDGIECPVRPKGQGQIEPERVRCKYYPTVSIYDSWTSTTVRRKHLPATPRSISLSGL